MTHCDGALLMLCWCWLQVILTTNHGGKFSFRVCPRRRDLDDACFGSNYLTR
jgi:hypothetical protein